MQRHYNVQNLTVHYQSGALAVEKIMYPLICVLLVYICAISMITCTSVHWGHVLIIF